MGRFHSTLMDFGFWQELTWIAQIGHGDTEALKSTKPASTWGIMLSLWCLEYSYNGHWQSALDLHRFCFKLCAASKRIYSIVFTLLFIYKICVSFGWVCLRRELLQNAQSSRDSGRGLCKEMLYHLLALDTAFPV